MENGQEAASLDIGEKGLVEILSLVVKEVRDSVGRDINGADLLYSLLNTPWLQSLLKVYECLQKHLRSPASPQLSYASGLSLEIVSDLRALEHPSYEARELYSLLTSPHIQALLSAHDVVGLKDYEPALPPLPEELPDDEEAIRIVCLVKNNQPLDVGVSRGIGSNRMTFSEPILQKLTPPRKSQNIALNTKKADLSPRWKTLRKFVISSDEIPASTKSVPASPQSSAHWERSRNSSAPCVYNSVVSGTRMDKPSLSVPSHHACPSPLTNNSESFLTSDCHNKDAPPLPPKVLRYTRTAPPSPMLQHYMVQNPMNYVNLPIQKSLDVELLGQTLTSVTECISVSMQENAKAVIVLAQALEKLGSASKLVLNNEASEESNNTSITFGKKYSSAKSPASVLHPDTNRPIFSTHLRHVHHFSYSSSSSSSSCSSSDSNCLDQPIKSQSRTFQPSCSTTSPKSKVKAKLPPTSPRRQDDGCPNIPNGQAMPSSPHSRVESSNKIGCFSKCRKKKK